jgi:NitT/TauT family transport system substrate-binding protein
MRMTRALVSLMVTLVLAGCGGSSVAQPRAGASAASPASSAAGASAKPAASPAAAGASAKPAASGQAAPKPAGSAATAKPAAAAYTTTPLSPEIKLKAVDSGATSQTPLYIASDRGYFKAEGLDVELVPMNDISQSVQMVALNQVAFQVALADPIIFNALDRGVDLKILASSTVNKQGDRPAVFQVRQDLIDSGHYKGPADLKGANIAIGAQSSQFYVERILAPAGLTIDDVKVTTIRLADVIAAFANKGIDAGWVTEPQASTIEKQKLAKTIAVTGDIFPNSVAAALVMSPTFGKEQPEAVRRFVIAYLRGLRDYYHAFNKNDGDREPVVQSLVKHTTLKDPAQYSVIGLPSVDPNAAVDPAPSWGQFQDFYIKRGIQQHKVDLSKFVDFSLINAAVERVGRES